MTFVSPKIMYVVMYTPENSFKGSPWNSICRPSHLESIVMTTVLYCIF